MGRGPHTSAGSVKPRSAAHALGEIWSNRIAASNSLCPSARAGRSARCRVRVPDLRGAGWSDAPRGRYPKGEMADDLVAVLDQLGVDRAWIAAHDWGGLAGFILLLRHPDRVTGFAGFNTVAPWLRLDGPNLRHAWAFYYQYPLLFPGIGPRLIGSSKQRYVRWLARWA